MSWLPFALLAPAIMTLVMFGDKYVIERQIPDSRAVLIYLGITNFTFSAVLFVLTGFPILPMEQAMPLFLAGAFTIWGNVFYFRAIAMEETSNIIIFLQLIPVFTLILGVLFLQEWISPQQLLGFLLIIASCIGVSRDPKEKAKSRGLQLSWAFWLVLIASLFFAISFVLSDDILDTYVIDIRTLVISTMYSAIGYSVGTLVLYLVAPPIRNAFNQHIRTATTKTFGSVYMLEGLFFLRQLALFLAISLGPVALVTVLSSTSVFFGIVLGWIFTLIAPQIFKEDIRRENLTRKALWAGVLFVGLLLL